jgi:threonine synthase
MCGPAEPWQGLIVKYHEFLPVGGDTPVITLLEGNTPLVYAQTLSKEVGQTVFLKFDGANPTGSFKDRGMTVAISKAVEDGATAVMCASTGNTSASAAAYAARAGLKCFVLIPEGKIAYGKLAQALVHGAKVLSVKGNFDAALKIVKEITATSDITLVNSLNDYRIEGQKTAAFEVCDNMGEAPEYLFIPVGNAGNITSYWKGFREYKDAAKVKKLPKMMGWQAEGAAPIVRDEVVENPQTIATAIRIGNPARWQEAAAAGKDSGGAIGMVSDEEILAAYRHLAAKEGVFAEPASAASVAGLLKASAAGQLEPGGTVVCVLTGHGLKDPDTAVNSGGGEVIEVEADTDAIRKLVTGA